MTETTTVRLLPRGPAAWQMLAVARFLCVVIGAPLFWFGSLTKDATPAEKMRWQIGFVVVGTGVALACISGLCFVVTKAATRVLGRRVRRTRAPG